MTTTLETKPETKTKQQTRTDLTLDYLYRLTDVVERLKSSGVDGVRYAETNNCLTPSIMLEWEDFRRIFAGVKVKPHHENREYRHFHILREGILYCALQDVPQQEGGEVTL